MLLAFGGRGGEGELKDGLFPFLERIGIKKKELAVFIKVVELSHFVGANYQGP